MFSAVHGIISSLTCLGPMSQYGFIGVFCQAFLCILTMGPYISPLVPTPIERRYLSCPCDSCPESGHFCGIWWNPVESFLAESPAKIAIPGTIYSGGIEPFWNCDRNGPGMDQNRIRWNAFCMYNK